MRERWNNGAVEYRAVESNGVVKVSNDTHLGYYTMLCRTEQWKSGAVEQKQQTRTLDTIPYCVKGSRGMRAQGNGKK